MVTARRTTLAAILVVIAYSHYWPAWGGVNGNPHGHVANGDAWQTWAHRGAACPADWPLGTRLSVAGQVWTCVDRGSAVGYTKDGRPIIDFLTDTPEHPFKAPVTALVLPPAALTQAADAALDCGAGRELR